MEIDRAAMSSTIIAREAALRDEREQFGETKAAFRAQFAQLSAEALKDNGEKFLETARWVLALQHKAAEGDLFSPTDNQLQSCVHPCLYAGRPIDGQRWIAWAVQFGGIRVEEEIPNSRVL